MNTQDFEAFLAHPAFSEIDRHFGRHIASKAHQNSKLTGYAAAILSLVMQRGHICLHLNEPPRLENMDAQLFSPWPGTEEWREDLLAGKLVAEDDSTFLPMVLDEAGRLYMHRYSEYERDLAQAIVKRLNADGIKEVSEATAQSIDRLFDPGTDGFPDFQKAAALTASKARFMVLAGGPGTGKTTTILKILTVLLESDAELKIALVAPTGKAANRMEESILNGIRNLDTLDEIKEKIPRKASTIHRLLGPRGDSAFFRHDASNPVGYDIVVVDECSMVDLPIMAKLFDALRSNARVILAGDPDQLASVEVGSVLTDIVRAATGNKASIASPGKNLSESIITLQKNYRFSEESGIHRLCQAIRAGNGKQAIEILESDRYPDVKFTPLDDISDLNQQLCESDVVKEYRKALAFQEPCQILEGMACGRILCAVKAGPVGVVAINRRIESILREEKLIGPNRFFYDRRPVIVVRNDYAVRLFNGDIGILIEDPMDGRLYVHFQAEQNTTKKILAVRLPDHESAFAMTVHRSQGSEFDHVLTILPPTQSPILTRELLYTAVSRAKKSVTVWADPETILWACGREVTRASGLSDRLLT